MDWQRIEDILREMFTPMPNAETTILWIVAATGVLGIAAALGGLLRGPRALLWLLLGATVSGTLIAVLAFRIGDAPPAGARGEVILEPFEGFRHAAGPEATRIEAANFYGNIALFVPLGFVLVPLFSGWLLVRILAAGAIGVALSAAIELTQTTMDRVSDINDVILNGSGAVLGATLGCALLIATRLGKAIGRQLDGGPSVHAQQR